MGEKSRNEVATEQPDVYVLPSEPMSETDIFVCGSGMTDCINKNDGHHAQTIHVAHHHAQY